MNTIEINPTAAQNQELADIVEEIAAKLQAGEPCNIDDYACRYPGYADRLRDWMSVVTAMADLGHSIALKNRVPISHTSSGASRPSLKDTDASNYRPTAGVLGDFRILREVGRGGMGVVYEAEQISLGRRVALKVLPFAAMLDKQQLARFKNEARAAATLDHPNIVAIYSVGSDRGVHYYAMQLIEGRSLAEIIASMKPDRLPSADETASIADLSNRPIAADTAKAALPTVHTSGGAAFSNLHIPGSTFPIFSSREYFRAVAELGIQAAEALDQAHQNGILHRDIKPANLLVDDTGKLWITDFGLARIEQDAGLTMTGDLLGTLRYMSPEQAHAKRVVVDYRSDIYSLGVTLYELLTLEPAFTGDDRHELFRQIAFDEPRKPRQTNNCIPHDLETIILKAIRKSPDDRYSAAQHLADDLKRYLSHQAIKAKAPTRRERILKWSRRHVTAVWAAAVVLLICTLILIVASFQVTRWYREAERQRGVADLQRIEAEKQKDNAEATANFLQQMLATANPDQVKGTDFTVRQLLDEFTSKLHDQFANQPEVEATLRSIVGNAYARLHIEDAAERHLRTALKIRRSIFGDNHISVADSLVDLAWFSYAREQRPPYNEIIGHAEKAISIYGAIGDSIEGRLRAYSVIVMARASLAQLKQGRFEDAEAAAQSALSIAGNLDTCKHAVVATILHTLSRVQNDQGRHADAEETARISVKLHRRLHGDSHPETGWALVALGDALEAQQKLPEAAAAYREALAAFSQQFSPHHSDVARAVKSLLRIADAEGDRTRYDAIISEAISELDAELQAKPNLLAAWIARGNYYELANQLEKAKESYSRAIELEPDFPEPYQLRGMLNLKLDLPDQARADFDALVMKSPRNAAILNLVAWILATSPKDSVRDGAEAVTLAQQACELTKYKSSDLIDTLAAAYAEAGDFQTAAKWVKRAIELSSDPSDGAYSPHRKNFEQGKAWREEP